MCCETRGAPLVTARCCFRCGWSADGSHSAVRDTAVVAPPGRPTAESPHRSLAPVHTRTRTALILARARHLLHNSPFVSDRCRPQRMIAAHGGLGNASKQHGAAARYSGTPPVSVGPGNASQGYGMCNHGSGQCLPVRGCKHDWYCVCTGKRDNQRGTTARHPCEAPLRVRGCASWTLYSQFIS